MTYYALSALVNAVTGIVVGLAILWQSDRRGKNLVSGLLSLFIGLWSLFYFLWLNADSREIAVFYNQILTFWAIFLPFLFLHFIVHVAGDVHANRWWIRIGYAVSGVLSILNFTSLFVSDYARRGDFPYWPIPGPAFGVYGLLFVTYIGRCAVVLFRAGLRLSGLQRRRMMYSVAGVVLVVLAGGTNFPLLYGINVPPVGNVLASFIVLHILLAHMGTFTRRVIITTSYVLLLGFLGVGLFVAWNAGKLFLPEGMQEPSAAVLFLFCGAGAVFFFPRFQRVVDQAYYPEYSRLAEKLAQLELRLQGATSLREFNDTLVEGVRHVFGAATARLVGGPDVPEVENGSVVVPLKAEKMPAFLVLGPKESGLPYSTPEIEEVSAFSRLGELLSKVDQLQETRSSLQKDVMEKTEELRRTQALLLRNERLAAIGQMSSVVSHELKTPLAVIQNSLYFLRKKEASTLDEKALKHLENIEDQAQVLKGIISDVLDYSRDRATSRAPGNLGAELSRLCESFPVPEGAKLETDFPADLPMIPFDPREVRQAVSNLLLNAFQSMPGGGAVRISVRLAGGGAEITVSDQGCGIPAEDIEKIFEPFFTTKSQGTGLGLAVVKKIVDSHGGSVSVESAVGAGSRITLRLPG